MSTNRYNFSNFIEDEELSVILFPAKELLQKMDNIVEIYQKNNELLYGQSPKQMLFLMKQNNKPLYSSNLHIEGSSRVPKSNQVASSPVSRNSPFLNVPRILLPNSPPEETEIKVHYSRKSETNTPVRRETVIKSTSNLSIADGETVSVDEQFSSPEASRQDSPRSAELALKTANLKIDEKDLNDKNIDTNILNLNVDETIKVDSNFSSPVSSIGSPKEGNKDSPGSTELVMMTGTLSMDDKEIGSPVKIRDCYDENIPNSISMGEMLKVEEKDKNILSEANGQIKARNEETPSSRILVSKECGVFSAEKSPDANIFDLSPVLKSRNSESDSDSSNKDSISPASEAFRISKIRKGENETSISIKKGNKTLEDRNASNISHPGEKAEINAPDSNKDSDCLGEEIVNIPRTTPIPIKRSKMCSNIVELSSEFVSPYERIRIAESSPEDTKVISPTQGGNMNISEDNLNTENENGERKRKSPTLIKKNLTIFKSIPKVIQSAGEELDIEVPYDSEGNPSPTTSGSASAGNSPKNRSPLARDSKTDDSPKTFRRSLSPLEKAKASSLSTTPKNKSPLASDSDADDSPKTFRRSLSPLEKAKTFSLSTTQKNKSPLASDTKTDDSPNILRRPLSPLEAKVLSLSTTPKNKSPLASDIKTDDSPNILRRLLSPLEAKVLSPSTTPKNKSPLASDSEIGDSPKTGRRILSPLGKAKAYSIDSSTNIEKTTNSGRDDSGVSAENKSSTVPAATNLSHRTEPRISYEESEYFKIKYTILNFNTLASLRNRIVQKIFNSLVDFHENIAFLNKYADDVEFILNTISISDYYSFLTMKNNIEDALGITSKLTKKLRSWKIDLELDLRTLQKCFEQIQRLKTHYGPLESDHGKPLITMESLQVYELELKAIWKKMDDIIMMGDTRRSLFSQTARDFDKLIKIFVKCLIMVGILQPH